MDTCKGFHYTVLGGKEVILSCKVVEMEVKGERTEQILKRSAEIANSMDVIYTGEDLMEVDRGQAM